MIFIYRQFPGQDMKNDCDTLTVCLSKLHDYNNMDIVKAYIGYCGNLNIR